MSDGQFWGIRKRKKEKVENLYKILGTRSNIGQERIKEKYIEKLREFPPETHPEEFQEIRRAYETLRDVRKRRQYDMLRKYGQKIEDAMEDVMFYMNVGKFNKAKDLLESLLKMDPENRAVKLTYSELLLELEDLDGFNKVIDEVVEQCNSEEKEYVIYIKCSMLINKGHMNMALNALEQSKKYISNPGTYHIYMASMFMHLEDYHKAWEEFTIAIKLIENLTMDDLDFLITWLHTGIELEKWGEISKIQSYILKLSQTLNDEYELSILKDLLIGEVDSYEEMASFRQMDVFMQLLSQIFKNDKDIKERRKHVQRIAKLEIELFRSMKDQELFPYVYYKVLDLFLARYSSAEYYRNFLDDIPRGMLNEMEWMKEDIAHGVLRMKKRYPVLFKEFNGELTNLLNESTEGLNREQKRGLK